MYNFFCVEVVMLVMLVTPADKFSPHEYVSTCRVQTLVEHGVHRIVLESWTLRLLLKNPCTGISNGRKPPSINRLNILT